MRTSVLIAIAFGLPSALGALSCGTTCPGKEPNCGTTNGSSGGSIAGAGGAAGASSTASCSQLTAFRSCMNAFCATATNPFCTCYTRGMLDLDPTTCLCVPFDAQSFCALQPQPAGTYNCSIPTSAVATTCIGVQ